MRKTLFLMILLLVGSMLKSQDIDLKFSDLMPATMYYEAVTSFTVGDKIMVVESKAKLGKKMSLMIYEAENLKFVKEVPIKDRNIDGLIDEKFSYLQTLTFNDNFIMFFHAYDGDKDEHVLFAQKFDKDGEFVGNFTIIDKIKAKKRRNSGNFYISVSEDSTKFLVVSSPPYEKYAGEKFGFKVYDSKLKNQSNTDLALPLKDKNVSLIDYLIGNDSKVYILTKVNLERKQKEKGEAPYYYSIITMEPKDNSMVENKVELPKRDIEDIAIRLNNDKGEINCAGFYSDIKPNAYTGNDIDGFFYLTLDVNSWRTVKSGFKALDKKLISEITGKTKLKDGKGISSTFEILKIINKSDGSLTIVSENRYTQVVYTSTMNSGGMTTSSNVTYHYFRKSLFIVNMAKDGSVESFVHIPKNQHFSSAYDLEYGPYGTRRHTFDVDPITSNSLAAFSVLIMEKEDRLVLVYNDNVDNMDPEVKSMDDVSSISGVKKAVVVAAEIFKDGSYKKTQISDNAVQKVVLLPEKGINVASAEYIVPMMITPSGCSAGTYTMFKKPKRGLAKITLTR